MHAAPIRMILVAAKTIPYAIPTHQFSPLHMTMPNGWVADVAGLDRITREYVQGSTKVVSVGSKLQEGGSREKSNRNGRSRLEKKDPNGNTQTVRG